MRQPTKLQRAVFEAGVRQVDLAESIGISDSALSRYTLGRRRVPEPVLVKIASVLGVPLADLVDASPEPATESAAGSPARAGNEAVIQELERWLANLESMRAERGVPA